MNLRTKAAGVSVDAGTELVLGAGAVSSGKYAKLGAAMEGFRFVLFLGLKRNRCEFGFCLNKTVFLKLFS